MTRIIIFAKAPLPGFAKTRLISALGQAGAAKLARQMLFNTLREAINAEVGTVELCVTPAIHHSSWGGIQLPAGVEISDQGEGDLGARLALGSHRALEQGGSVLLIGTDCVEMSAPLLQEAATALERKDVVIYPTADGGYALLGLTRFHLSLFSDIAWSTGCVASETIGRIKRLGWSLEMGSLLHDVDEPDSLKLVPKNWL